MNWVLDLAMGGLAVAAVLSFIRIPLGPTTHDRILALGNLSSTVVGLVAVSAMWQREPVLLDALIVIALLGFISTVALARYLERGAHP